MFNNKLKAELQQCQEQLLEQQGFYDAVHGSVADERTAQIKVHYLDGRSSMRRGEMRGDRLDIYFDGRLV